MLEIGRGNRPDFFNLDWAKPRPFVPRHLRRELPGRLTQLGAERAPLDVDGRLDRRGLQGRRRRGDRVCLLNAYADPRHELAALAAIRGRVARRRGRRVAPDHPRVAGVRANQHGRPLRLRAAAAERYLARLADRRA